MKNIFTVQTIGALIIGLAIGAFFINPGTSSEMLDGGDMLEMGSGAGMDMSAMDQSNMDMSNSEMKDMMMDMTARMDGKKGDELDKIFLEDMIIHHQGALDMAVVMSKGTQREEMKKFADDIINAQSGEIDMMKKWLEDWFGVQS
jgi:uncharacterized protein (DUF305 family)